MATVECESALDSIGLQMGSHRLGSAHSSWVAALGAARHEAGMAVALGKGLAAASVGCVGVDPLLSVAGPVDGPPRSVAGKRQTAVKRVWAMHVQAGGSALCRYPLLYPA